MLSILIPVYNFEVTTLVRELVRQAQSSGITYEVLCFDDGSETDIKIKHCGLKEIPGVDYREMAKNLGRAAIRNALAEAAQYPYLLFMDGDSKVFRPDYIERYVEYIDPETLLYGGRVYDDQPPKDPQLLFHWQYGRQREQMAVERRQENPYHAFQTNNFLIPKALFETIRFDESIRQYGHEDTLFGFELRRKKIPVKHIDNPLEHIGLEPAEVFLRKTEKGIENLLQLAKQYPFIETRLLQTYRSLVALGLAGLVRKSLKPWKNDIKGRLLRGEQHMRWFDIYKLSLILRKAQAIAGDQ